MIGVSCYDDLGARDADVVAQGADYVAFGSFFPSPVKPGARRADVALLAQAKSLGVPVVAIGGITADNARAAGRRRAPTRVAVISAVFAHDDLADVTRAAAAIAACFDRPNAPDAEPTTMSRNEELFARAQRTIPAGVNSPVRAFRSVGGTPRFLTRGAGRRTCGTPTARATSTTSARGGRRSSATRIRTSCAPCRRRPCTDSRSARRPRARS